MIFLLIGSRQSADDWMRENHLTEHQRKNVRIVNQAGQLMGYRPSDVEVRLLRDGHPDLYAEALKRDLASGDAE